MINKFYKTEIKTTADSELISVIVPVYNMEQTLRRALDSLVEQSCQNYEVIMVDDGSKDSSGIICEEYAERFSNFRVLHKPNGGLSSARNAGMAIANGEWVTFCDSDDYVFSDWLSNFNHEKYSEFDLICQGVVTDKPINNLPKNEGKKRYGIDFEGVPSILADLLYKENVLGYTYLKLYRLNIIRDNSINFNEKLYLREDEEFLLRYLNYCQLTRSTTKAGYFYFVPEWHNKYDLKFEIEEIRMLSSYKSLKSLMGEERNSIYCDFFESVIDFYCRMFFYQPGKRKYCLSQLHILLKEAEIEPNMFWLTRMAIKSELYKIVGAPILHVHHYLRNKLQRS